MPSTVKSTVITSPALPEDRKSTRLNSSHSQISYAVFCLKKKKIKINNKVYNLIKFYRTMLYAVRYATVFLLHNLIIVPQSQPLFHSFSLLQLCLTVYLVL